MKTQFAHPSEGIEITRSQNSFFRPISKAESSASKSVSENIATSNWPVRIRAFGLWIANFAFWIAKASIVRKVAPGARALERHEFESIQSRRGGFGNVF